MIVANLMKVGKRRLLEDDAKITVLTLWNGKNSAGWTFGVLPSLKKS
jgi:hypothetical protein